MHSLSRALLTFSLCGVFGGLIAHASAQERICPTILPSSAALLSDGTLGVGFPQDINGNPSGGFSNIRPVQEYNGCHTQQARRMMEDMCIAFMTKVRVGVDPVTQPSCAIEQEALKLSADENVRLKRVIRRLKAQLARK